MDRGRAAGRRSTAGTTYVHIRYVGNQLDKWGLSYWRLVAGRKVYVIEINQERHRRWKWFLPERHLEAQTLIHEYGHHLGLPPWDHGYYRDYPDFSDGAHCVNPDCALSKPRARALLYGFWHVAHRSPLPRGLLRAVPRRHRRRQGLLAKERASISQLVTGSAVALVILAHAVAAPAGDLVEAPRTRVLLEHPQHRVAEIRARVAPRRRAPAAPGRRRCR